MVKPTEEYESDPRVRAAEDELWYAFKNLFESVQEAHEAIRDMAVIAVRAIDRMEADAR